MRGRLFEDWNQASFENDSKRLIEIDGIKASLDDELERLTQNREAAKKRIEDNPLDAVGIAEMLGELSALKAPTLINFHNLGYLKPMAGTQAGFLDRLITQHELVEAEINGLKSAISDMEQWSRYTANEPAPEAFKKPSNDEVQKLRELALRRSGVYSQTSDAPLSLGNPTRLLLGKKEHYQTA